LDEGLAATAAAYASSSSQHGPFFPINTTSYISSSSEWRQPEHVVPTYENQTYQQNHDVAFAAGDSDASGSDSASVTHNWIQVGSVTTSKSLKPYVVDVSSSETKYFLCGWNDCRHPVEFNNKSQLITHIRSVHLQEKPFLCTTCQTSFARKQDAIRHVETANSGKRFKCDICDKTFARKSYRDSHQNLCVERRAVLAGYLEPPRYT